MKHDFDEKINRRKTYCTQWDYTKDRFGRSDVIPFSISDTDFALPQKTIEVLTQHLQKRIYGYTRWNHTDFKNSIEGWYQKRFDYKINKNWITYSPTVIYSLAELVRLITRGKKVMTLDPAYGSFFDVISQNGLERQSETLILGEQYYINNETFEQNIKECDILIFCNPHNPIGKVYSKSEIRSIVEICKKNDVFIISDEIHMDITLKNVHIPLLKVAEESNYENKCCIITSATKTFNFPGLIFSYALIPDSNLKDKFEESLKYKNGLSSCGVLGLLATMDVYNNQESYVDQLNEYIIGNVEYVQIFLKEHIPKIEFTVHQSTYLMWFNLTSYESKFRELLELLYSKYKIGLMDGTIYGMKNHLRINVGCPKSKLEYCMAQLKLAIIEIEEN